VDRRWAKALGVFITGVLAAAIVLAMLLFRTTAIYATRQRAVLLRSAVRQWRKDHAGCPALDAAVAGQVGLLTTDAWGRPYVLQCADREVIVRSAGPDAVEGTSDDIVLPEPAPHGGACSTPARAVR
jgi:hypothetical protein